MIREDTNFTSKIHRSFSCEKCNFICYKKGDWNRHILTSKHQKIHKDITFTSKNINSLYVCNCGNTYKYHSGLWRHKNKGFCTKKLDTNINDYANNLSPIFLH